MTPEFVPELVPLLTSSHARHIFSIVADQKRVSLRDLKLELNGTGNDSSATDASIEQLKHAKLIEEIVAPVRDFNVYAITGSGITAARKLRAIVRSSAG